MEPKTETIPPLPLLRSRKEARAILGGIGQSKLDQLLNEGLLLRVKVGRRAMVSNESIQSYVQAKINEQR